MELTAAILAGGLGTRLRSALADRPKVLAPVGGRPFLTHLLDQLADAGIRGVVLLTGHRAAEVHHTFGSEYKGMCLTQSAEPSPLGTAGALRRALPLLEASCILLLNGDSYCDVQIEKLYEFHGLHKAGVSLSLVHVPDASRFGRVCIDLGGRVIAFEEKGISAGSGWINAGVYLLERDLLAALPAGCPLSLEREVLPGWVSRGMVYGMECGDRFIDIGTPESYAEAENFFSASIGRSPTRC
jgi:NDP-sugar pyrophosphorylase family protein